MQEAIRQLLECLFYEISVRNFDASKHLKTHPNFLGRARNRPKLDDLKSGLFPTVSKMEAVDMNREKRMKYRELQKRMERERELRVVVDKLQLRKQLAVM